MERGFRKSGTEVIGNVPWATHFCQFYQTKKDLLDILVPYFKAGLENNEFCMWVTAEPLIAEDARKAMAKAVPGFSKYLKKGQIEILPHTEWYLKGGSFDSERVLNGWVEKLNQALAKGYEGLRLTGNTLWLEKKDWKSFTDYEAAVNDVIGKYNMLALCTYCLDRCSATEIIDVIRNHDFALVRKEGKWELIESSVYKRAKEALEKSQHDLNRAQAVAHTGSWRLDIQRNELLWSDETHRLFGIPKETPMTYETFLATVHSEDRQYVDQKWTAALRGEDYDTEHRIVVGNEVKWVRERAELEFEQGVLKGGFGTVQDITERKQAEEEVKRLNESLQQHAAELEAANKELEKMDQLKDEFIGLVSHELRTPVTVILGALNTVLGEGGKLSQEEIKQLIEDAYRETETLSDILANLLELARVQANRLQLLEEPLDMKEFIGRVIRGVKRRATTHEFAIDCRGSLMVSADRVRVERILLNLLDNAVKYSPPGSTIRVLARQNANEIVIGVCDKGVGISAEDQKRLFQPFQRLGMPDEKVGGTGLGLVVCQRLVEAQGGRIWVESQPGQGSTFYFTLPALDIGSYRTRKA